MRTPMQSSSASTRHDNYLSFSSTQTDNFVDDPYQATKRVMSPPYPFAVSSPPPRANSTPPTNCMMGQRDRSGLLHGMDSYEYNNQLALGMANLGIHDKVSSAHRYISLSRQLI